MLEKYESGRVYDMITGEMAVRGDMILDTGIRTIMYRPPRNNRTMFMKESTIVWLAEKAGYSLVKRDDGDSGHAEGVDGADVGVGGGEAAVRAVKAGGRKASK
jgi:hypothetical protein